MRIELGIPMSLQEIAAITGGQPKLIENSLITHICTDSREVRPKDLFIALCGRRFDGADYVVSAKRNEAFILSSTAETSDIFHLDTRRALIDLATYYVKNLPYLLYKIGITGSVGKTTTKEFLKILLSEKYKLHASAGNFNNEIGLPLSVLSAKKNTEVLVMEMGMNSRGEISRLSKCLCPNIAVITNIGSAHIGRLGSKEQIAEAKLEILDGMNKGKIIVPKEEKLLFHLNRKITFSTVDKEADIYLENNKNCGINIYKKTECLCSASFALPEEHHLKCLAAAVSVALESGLSPNELSQRTSHISGDITRQKDFFAEKYHFYVDCYNASRESMLATIKEFSQKKTKESKSLLLGEILELGDSREKIHIEVGESLSSKTIQRLFLYGKHAEEIGRGAVKSGFPSDRIYLNSNTDEPSFTAEQIRKYCDEGEHIFVKGSRGLRLERVVDCFKLRKEKNNE